MSCSYGPRGSLTAVCVNATAPFFKLTTYRFDNLDETLLCRNCTLNVLRESVFDIPGNEIRTLDIRNTSVQYIWPKAFMGMIHMEKLQLSHNSIFLIHPRAFEGIRKVRCLELEDALKGRLQPQVFKELHLLEVLDLSDNQLETLHPETFEGLHNLRLLDMSRNKLTALDTALRPLVNLRTLVLNDNSVHAVFGNEFDQLAHLTMVNLARNGMSDFSVHLTEPRSRLRTLNLAENSLSSGSFRPGAFENLTDLEELDLSENRFENISTKLFSGLHKLTLLDLSGNALRGINTGSFSGLPHLRVLNVSRNRLDSLTMTGRLQMHSLVILDLSDNDIATFDYLSLIRRAPRLRNIDLSNNSLSCSMQARLETLLALDHFEHVEVGRGAEGGLACSNYTAAASESGEELLDELKQQLEQPYVRSALLVWMFVLVAVAMLLIGVLFYVQFFVLLGMGSASDRSFRLQRNLASSEITDVSM